jgi:branched-chain amino acid transport system permease protein
MNGVSSSRKPFSTKYERVAAFIFAQLISIGGFYFHIEWGYVMAFVFFIVMMFVRPQGILGGKS